MNREDLIRELRKTARKADVKFQVISGRGKGSHYRVEFGEKWTTVQSGELSPSIVRRIKKQLGVECPPSAGLTDIATLERSNT